LVIGGTLFGSEDDIGSRGYLIDGKTDEEIQGKDLDQLQVEDIF
jgi:hypothetical protein